MEFLDQKVYILLMFYNTLTDYLPELFTQYIVLQPGETALFFQPQEYWALAF